MKNSAYAKISDYFENNKDQLFGFLSRLIKINTENNRTTCRESDLTSYLSGEYEGLGIATELYTPDSVEKAVAHPDFTHGKSFLGRENLTAKIRGKDPKRAMMLAAHADTMPIGDPGLWTVPPTGGIIRDGRIYGRGACDDKYALASMFFFAKAVKELGIELKNDLYLTAYVDEEFGGGNGALSAAIKYPCDFYLNLDCKNFDIWTVAAGGQRIVLHLVHPKEQHSCEAVMEGLFIAKRELDVFGRERILALEKNEKFKNSIIPRTAFRYMNMGTGLNTNDRNRGVIDFAFYSDRTKEEIWDELRCVFSRIEEKILPLGLKIGEIVESSRYFTYGYVDENDPTIRLLKSAAESVTGNEIHTRASCLSDLSLFLAAAPGRSAAFGAGRDFDVPGGAHLPDEYIECESLYNFAKSIAKFILEWDEID